MKNIIKDKKGVIQLNSVSGNQSDTGIQLGLFDAIRDLLFVDSVL